MSIISRVFHVGIVHVLATLLVVGLALSFAAVADAQSECAGGTDISNEGRDCCSGPRSRAVYSH